jgi:phosphate/sulfate permease
MEHLADLSLFNLGILLFALLLVFLFEFINGFHDTANAVATVIYTRTLKPVTAVVWSGCWNFIGVLLSGSAVAMSILKLAPMDLIASADTNSAIAMVIVIPLAAIFWNFGTWYVGLPVSSSHTLIGSFIGVGLAHSMLQGRMGAGVNWDKAIEVGLSLLISPFVGFAVAGLLLLVVKQLLKNPDLHNPPLPGKAPPPWVRGLLILTCTGVSFAHGTNDGQKGIGLMMLVLIVMLPAMHSFDPSASLDVPLWVKMGVALTLGCGTMIGWKRVVVTVGEKIGKKHLNYAQGAVAELVAMVTIQSASLFGMPVSTTHVLSSGIAGTMMANHSGLQQRTVRNIILAWVLTLPASVVISSALFAGSLFFLLQALGLN